METIVLIGAEDVKLAGTRISLAADSMRQTVSHLDDMLVQFFPRAEELVRRIETSIEKVNINFMNLDDHDFESLLERMRRLREMENG